MANIKRDIRTSYQFHSLTGCAKSHVEHMRVNVLLIVDQLLVTIILMLFGLVVDVKWILIATDYCDCVEARNASLQY
jgi:hypothetical protein